MTKVKANVVNATDDALVNKLQKQVQHLREVLHIRGKNDLQSELFKLKQENDTLKSNMSEVERLLLENKMMKMQI